MKKLAVLVTLVTVLAVVACGGQSQAQVRSCWNKAIASYSKSQTNIPGAQQALEQGNATVAALYEEGKPIDPGMLATGELAYLKQTQQKCGKLKVSAQSNTTT